MPDQPQEPRRARPDAVDRWPGRWAGHDHDAVWLGDPMHDLQLRPGEDVEVPPDDLEAQVAARRFRDVLGRFASGVTVVTATVEGHPVGLTCQSFSSVSLDPPLVLFVPARSSRAWPEIRRSGRFCVNFLGDGQQELSDQMASRGTDKFAEVEWTPTRSTGSPLLAGSVGWVDCTIETVHEAGDHDVVIGRVVALGVGDAEQPLLFYRGRYHTTDGSLD